MHTFVAIGAMGIQISFEVEAIFVTLNLTGLEETPELRVYVAAYVILWSILLVMSSFSVAEPSTASVVFFFPLLCF